jgi:hypothetical protein
MSTTNRDHSDGKTLHIFLTLLIEVTQDHLKWKPDDGARNPQRRLEMAHLVLKIFATRKEIER